MKIEVLDTLDYSLDPNIYDTDYTNEDCEVIYYEVCVDNILKCHMTLGHIKDAHMKNIEIIDKQNLLPDLSRCRETVKINPTDNKYLIDSDFEYYLKKQYPQHEGLSSPWYNICHTTWLNRLVPTPYNIEKLNKMISPEEQLRFVNNILYNIKELPLCRFGNNNPTSDKDN